MLWTMQPLTIGEDIEFLHPGGKIDIKGKVLKVGYGATRRKHWTQKRTVRATLAISIPKSPPLPGFIGGLST